MKHTFSMFGKKETNQNAMITNAPGCSIATDEGNNNTYCARPNGSGVDIADSALPDPDISASDLAPVTLAVASLADAAYSSKNAVMAEADIASSAFFVAALDYSVVDKTTLSAVDTATAELTVGAVSAVVLKCACQRKEQNCLDTNRVTTHKHENAHFLDLGPRTSMC